MVERWGLNQAAITGLGERLEAFWAGYGALTRTRTRDRSEYGRAYVSGLLRMQAKRTMANIARQSGKSEQNMQHYMSESPWSSQAVLDKLQGEVAARTELAGGILILDESGEEKSGKLGAGVARQYNSRHRQVEQCQVGVFLAYAAGTCWTWLDGELYLSERWFSPEYAHARLKSQLPPERVYHKKTELGWQMIERARARGIPFVAVTFDSLYGQDSFLRERCRAEGLEYYADIKANMLLYLSDPSPVLDSAHNKRAAKRPSVLQQLAWRASELVNKSDTVWHPIDLRTDERGILSADFAVRPVWTLAPDGQVVAETLLLRRDGTHITYSLTNASPDTPSANPHATSLNAPSRMPNPSWAGAICRRLNSALGSTIWR